MKKKIFGGIVLSSVLAVSGCSFVDNQEAFMSKVIEYIDEQDAQQKEELKDQLKEYLNDEKKLNQEEIKNLFLEKTHEYEKMLGKNYTVTLQYSETSKQVMRVEYRGSGVYVHAYTLNADNTKTKEVYIVSKDDKVHTYLKDAKLTSEVSLESYLSDINECKLTGFSTYNCLAEFNSDDTSGTKWEEYEGVEKISYLGLDFEDTIEELYQIVYYNVGEYDSYLPYFYYENKDEFSVALSWSGEGQYINNHQNISFVFGEDKLEVHGTGFTINKGTYMSHGETKASYKFDNEETISFDTIGYTPVTSANKKAAE